MPEVIIRHTHRLQVVDSNIHVQRRLDIVLGNAAFLELFSSFSHRIGDGLVLLRNPTALSGSLFLFVPLFLVVLAK
jgi:hypothetical protein